MVSDELRGAQPPQDALATIRRLFADTAHAASREWALSHTFTNNDRIVERGDLEWDNVVSKEY